MGRRRKGSGLILKLYLVFIVVIFVLPLLIMSCGRNRQSSTNPDTLMLPYSIISEAYKYSLSSGIGWSDLLSYSAVYKDNSNNAVSPFTVQQVVDALYNGKYRYNNTVFKKNKQYYSLLFDGTYGSYKFKRTSPVTGTTDNTTTWRNTNGIRLFYPIPTGYSATHNDDFGKSRSYDGIASHEGNDLMAETGTPVVAIESGFVDKIGWNNAGGYRISILSQDGKRLYYYAHFSKYSDATKLLVPRRGSEPTQKKYIEAGSIIGYVGSTGNSKKVGTSGLFPSHLHVQIGICPAKNKTTWVNPYGFIKFVENNGLRQTLDNPIIIGTR